MPKLRLRFTYSTYGLFTEHRERIQKFNKKKQAT